MKATANTLHEVAVNDRSRWVVFADLIKARLTALVLLTTMMGYYLGQPGPVDLALMLHLLVATGLLASGAAALNQYWERDWDALMPRTRNRPLPAGRLQPETVLLWGGVFAVAGMLYLAIAVNLITAMLGALTLGSYVFIYTPLKRVTTLNTMVGAIPGALPPLMGWTAARGEVTLEGWALFAILFFWQLPHFLAIAWMYREQYSQAGFVMLPVVDPNGDRTAHQSVCHTLGLLPVSLSPFILQVSGLVYAAGALVLGLGFFALAVRFARHRSRDRARALFLGSIIYLPLLSGLMVLDKVPK